MSATLYATETHDGLAVVWVGTDLTGLPGTALKMQFRNPRTGVTFQGTGTFSAPVVTTVGGVVQSAMNYSPSVTDVAVSNIGEWQVQLLGTFGDATTRYSVPGVVTIQPRLQDQ